MGRWRERIRYRLWLSPLLINVRPSPSSRHLFYAFTFIHVYNSILAPPFVWGFVFYGTLARTHPLSIMAFTVAN